MSVETVRRSYAAFARGDLDGALAMMDDAVEWHQAQGLPHGGVYKGLAEVQAAVFDPLDEQWWDDFSADPEKVLALADDVVVLGRYTARAKGTGTALDVPFAHVWRFRDGAGGALPPVHRHARLGRGARSRRVTPGVRHRAQQFGICSTACSLQGFLRTESHTPVSDTGSEV